MFQIETDVHKYPPKSQAQLKLSTLAYESVNQRYLYINLPSPTFKVDDYASININFHYRDYLPLKTFSYQVKDNQILYVETCLVRNMKPIVLFNSFLYFVNRSFQKGKW